MPAGVTCSSKCIDAAAELLTRPWGGDRSSEPSQGRVGSCSCRLVKEKDLGLRGDSGRGPGPGELGRSQFVSARPCLGRLPVSTKSREEFGDYPSGGSGTSGFKLHWTWQEAPPPRAANKAVTPRVELWEPGNQAPWVGIRAGRLG